MAALTNLPDEIINHLLFYISADDALANVQLVSRRFHQLTSSPLLWRHHCRTAFAHWRESRHIQRKLDSPVSVVDWKRLFRSRKRSDARLAKIFESILATRHQRVHRLRSVCSLGEDARDYLLEQRRVPDSADDVWARR